MVPAMLFYVSFMRVVRIERNWPRAPLRRSIMIAFLKWL